MIVQLNCSMSWSMNDRATFPTGGLLPPDSVLISIEDLKIANAKMLELKYEKEINCDLRQIVSGDSIIIRTLNQRIDRINSDNKKSIQKVKTQRNILGGTSIGAILLLILSLL